MFFHYQLRIGITSERCGGQFVLLRCRYQIFFRTGALFIGGLRRELAVDLASSSGGGVGALLILLVIFSILFLLDVFPRLDAVEDLVGFPLRPYEIVAFPFVEVTH